MLDLDKMRSKLKVEEEQKTGLDLEKMRSLLQTEEEAVPVTEAKKGVDINKMREKLGGGNTAPSAPIVEEKRPVKKSLAERIKDALTASQEYTAEQEQAAKYGIIADEEDKQAEQLSKKYSFEGRVEAFDELADKDRFNKTYKDTFVGQTRANNAAAALAEKESLAWSKYLDSGSDADFYYATQLSNLRESFEEDNAEALDNENVKGGWISKTMASYLPQLANQAKYAAVGVLPGLATGNAALAKAGYAASQGLYGYQTMRGAAYKTLIEAGVDPDAAREAAKDEAVINGLIEAAEALITLGTKGAKLFSKAAGKEVASDTLKAALKKYGINIGTEALQEGAQEAVSYSNLNREDKEAGTWNLAGQALKTGAEALTGQNKEAARQIGAAAGEGAKIAAMLGAVSSAGSYLGQQGLDKRATNKEVQLTDADIEQIVQDMDDESATAVRRVYGRLKNQPYDATAISGSAMAEAGDKTAPSQYATNTMRKQAELGLFDKNTADAFANASHRVISQADTTAAAQQMIEANGFDEVRSYLQDKMDAKQGLNSVEIEAGSQIAQQLSRIASDPNSREEAFRFIDSFTNQGVSDVGRALAQVGAAVRSMQNGLLYYVSHRAKQLGGLSELSADEQNTLMVLDGLLKRAEEIDAMSEAERQAVLADYTAKMNGEYAGLVQEAFSKVGANDSSADWIMRLAEKMVADKVGSSYVDKYAAMQRINLLGNTKTQVRNNAGNIVSFGIENASDVGASIVDSWLQSKTGKRTVGKGKLGAAVEGGKQAVAEVNKARRLGVLGLMDNRYKETSTPRPLNVWSNNSKAGRLGNRLNEWTSYMLSLGDALYSGAREAQVESQLRELNGSDAAWISDVAAEAGKEVTFQNDSNAAKFAMGFRNLGQNLDSKAGQNAMEFITRVLMPFVKTPANIISRTFSYSPAGLIEGALRAYFVIKDGANADPIKQRKAAVAIGRGLTGTLISAAGMGLAAAGKASGKEAEDKDQAAFMKDVGGILPNSIKIGDVWVDLSNLGPGMVALNAGATVYNNLVDEGIDGNVAWRAVQALLDSAVSDVTGDSLWQGIIDTAAYIEDKNYKGLTADFVGDILSQMMPAQSFLRAITGSVDKYKRETSAANSIGWSVNYILSNIPGASQKFAVKYDAMGEAVERYEGGKASDIFNAWLNPAAGMSKDKTDSELYRNVMDLYEKEGSKSVFPTVAPYSVDYKGDKHALRGKERSEYQKTSGKEITQQLDDLFASKAYKQATSEQQVDMIADLIGYSTAEAKTVFLKGKDITYEKSGTSKTIEKLAASGVPASATVLLAATDRSNDKDVENSGAVKAAKTIVALNLDAGAEQVMLEHFGSKAVATAVKNARNTNTDATAYLDTWLALTNAETGEAVKKALRGTSVSDKALLTMLSDSASGKYSRFDSRWSANGRSYSALSPKTYVLCVATLDGSLNKAGNVKRLMDLGLSKAAASDFITLYNSQSSKYD